MIWGYSSILWLLTGVSFYASISHLLSGLRRPPDRLHLIFSFLALCAGFASIASIQMAAASTADEYLRGARLSGATVPAIFIALPWFVYQYAELRRVWPAALIVVPYALLLVISLTSPDSMLLSGPPVLRSVELPWGEVITTTTTPPSAWLQLLWIGHGGFFVYLIAACIKLHRSGPVFRAWGLTVSAIPYVLALLLNILAGYRVIHLPFFIGAFGFLSMILLMSVMLSGEWRRSHSQMQVVLDNVPAVVYLKNRDGRYAFVNRDFERLHGIASGQALGKTDAEVLGAVGAERFHHADHRVVESGRAIETEFSLTHDGQTHAYAALHFPLVDATGRCYAVCGIATDITERKQSADTLRELAYSLERRVARRTRDLAQVNRELEAFCYSVSHDLRAPLMTVHGFADLLLRDYAASLDQTGQKYLHRIRDGAKRMGSLIEDLLALSRVTREELQRVSCNLGVLAQDVVRQLQESDPARRATIEIASDLVVQGDARLLSVVMSNLLGNAWKYSARREDARIEIAGFEQDGEHVYFVRDNGAGFDPKLADRLFQPFKRLHSEQEFPGTGVGLATVARIVHRHGGRIWAEAKLGEGATFFFTLPPPDDESSNDLSQRATSEA